MFLFECQGFFFLPADLVHLILAHLTLFFSPFFLYSILNLTQPYDYTGSSSVVLYECGVNKGDRQEIFQMFNSAIILLMAGGMEHFSNTSSLKHCQKHRGTIGIFGGKKNQSSSVIDLARIGKANSLWNLPSLVLRQLVTYW